MWLHNPEGNPVMNELNVILDELWGEGRATGNRQLATH